MRFFLIDFENVHVNGLTGIQNLTADDRVIIFYSRHAYTLTMEMHIMISRSPAIVSYESVDSGKKNDLDIQLSSYLGYLIRENKGHACSYFIVSHDNGFRQLSAFWQHYNVLVVDSIDCLHHEESRQAVVFTGCYDDQSENGKGTPAHVYYDTIRALVESNEEAVSILALLYRSGSKDALHKYMLKYYHNDQKQTNKIYQKIKKYVDNIPFDINNDILNPLPMKDDENGSW